MTGQKFWRPWCPAPAVADAAAAARHPALPDHPHRHLDAADPEAGAGGHAQHHPQPGAVGGFHRQLLPSPCPCNTATSPWISCATWGSRFFVSPERGRDPHQRHPRQRAQDAGAQRGAGGAQPQTLRRHGDQGGLLPPRGAARLQQRHPAGGSPSSLGPLHPVPGAHQSAGAGDPDRDRTGGVALSGGPAARPLHDAG